ncbi:hypothetical protein A2379_05255 [Candidatus Amesbacteria bacterium RIFOXYB1_FULL_47_13]|nr:MAG: hypothetical protein A2379_05255 [Candidatus Amesbacteria bacterium RIFOXYB1_FULL_47_13]HBC72512.1 hypothetical protein [Candidatus Amesbacteria bacterium]
MPKRAIFLILIIFLAITVLVWFKTSANRPLIYACPMDANVCPDGTSVGRVLPDCKFAPCP